MAQEVFVVNQAALPEIDPAEDEGKALVVEDGKYKLEFVLPEIDPSEDDGKVVMVDEASYALIKPVNLVHYYVANVETDYGYVPLLCTEIDGTGLIHFNEFNNVLQDKSNFVIITDVSGFIAGGGDVFYLAKYNLYNSYFIGGGPEVLYPFKPYSTLVTTQAFSIGGEDYVNVKGTVLNNTAYAYVDDGNITLDTSYLAIKDVIDNGGTVSIISYDLPTSSEGSYNVFRFVGNGVDSIEDVPVETYRFICSIIGSDNVVKVSELIVLPDDSVKVITKNGGNLVVTVTKTQEDTYVVDKTYDEIKAAFPNVVAVCNFEDDELYTNIVLQASFESYTIENVNICSFLNAQPAGDGMMTGYELVVKSNGVVLLNEF